MNWSPTTLITFNRVTTQNYDTVKCKILVKIGLLIALTDMSEAILIWLTPSLKSFEFIVEPWPEQKS